MMRKFAEEKVRPVAAELDQKEQFSVELTRAMGHAGLFGVNIPKEYGGHGRDYRSLVLAVDEIARVDGSQAATLAAHNSLGIGPIYMFGTEEDMVFKYLVIDKCKKAKTQEITCLVDIKRAKERFTEMLVRFFTKCNKL